tara:strand:- start:390 stop:689 length:300 start_codon:yes stop_codon:yes gene_type:complete
MKLPPFNLMNPDIKLMVADTESLAKITFIKCMFNAQILFRKPRSFFAQMGIVLPPEIDEWEDLDLNNLVDLEGLMCRAQNYTELQSIVISSKGEVVKDA